MNEVITSKMYLPFCRSPTQEQIWYKWRIVQKCGRNSQGIEHIVRTEKIKISTFLSCTKVCDNYPQYNIYFPHKLEIYTKALLIQFVKGTPFYVKKITVKS